MQYVARQLHMLYTWQHMATLYDMHLHVKGVTERLAVVVPTLLALCMSS